MYLSLLQLHNHSLFFFLTPFLPPLVHLTSHNLGHPDIPASALAPFLTLVPDPSKL